MKAPSSMGTSMGVSIGFVGAAAKGSFESSLNDQGVDNSTAPEGTFEARTREEAAETAGPSQTPRLRRAAATVALLLFVSSEAGLAAPPSDPLSALISMVGGLTVGIQGVK